MQVYAVVVIVDNRTICIDQLGVQAYHAWACTCSLVQQHGRLSIAYGLIEDQTCMYGCPRSYAHGLPLEAAHSAACIPCGLWLQAYQL